MRKFLKKEEKNTAELTTEELLNSLKSKPLSRKGKIIIGSVGICVLGLFVWGMTSANNLQTASSENEQDFILASTPVAATSSKRDIIAIPSGVVKANPFVPYRLLGNEVKKSTLVNDVPKYDLIAPPDYSGAESEAAKIMDTTVSGILFDKYSPSAILKIDGSDYLVKKGDVVHNYKVLNIAQNSVTVQLGRNTYQAGIGEILTDGSVNYNDVSNLSKKFGGVQR